MFYFLSLSKLNLSRKNTVKICRKQLQRFTRGTSECQKAAAKIVFSNSSGLKINFLVIPC